jgi:TRAP-type C4-dicarboxylate transport system permease small subunit
VKRWGDVFGKLNKLIEGLSVFLFCLLCMVVFVGVIARYVFNRSLFWTEEVSIYLFTWVVFIGSYSAYRHNRHISISLFMEKLPIKVQKVIFIIDDFLILGFLVLFLAQSMNFTKMNQTMNSIALNIPLSYISASLAVMSLLMIIQACSSVVTKIKNFNTVSN